MKLKFEPGVLPRSATEITRAYIQDYVAHGVKAGEIKEEKLNKWIEEIEKIEDDTTKSHAEQFAAVRTLFINTFMPTLTAKKEKMSVFFKTLKAKTE